MATRAIEMYGYSDDLFYIEEVGVGHSKSDIADEFSGYDKDIVVCLWDDALAEGCNVRARYDTDGIWRIRVEQISPLHEIPAWASNARYDDSKPIDVDTNYTEKLRMAVPLSVRSTNAEQS